MSHPQHRQADVVLRDGSTVHVRPVTAEDAPAVRAFFEHLSPKSIGLRFFSGFPDLDRAVRWATDVEDQHRYGLVATSSNDGRVVAHAGWERDPDRPERAEVAFAIADATQHNGLGTILLSQLTQAANQAGVAVLNAEVLPQNHRMLHMFRDSGFPLTTRTLPGVILVELPTSLSPGAGALRTPRAGPSARRRG
jgi:acetate---CoA ligase (ADP-forming)